MSLDALRADLAASLGDAGATFSQPDLDRHLTVAAHELGRKRRRTLSATLQLVAGQSEYAAPADLVMPTMSSWGVSERAASRPWRNTWPGRLPRLTALGDPGAMKLLLTPAPTAQQIQLLGASYPFYYLAAHHLDADATKTTVREVDRGLLLLRAQAEAMKELAMRNLKKPVSMREGLNASPRNGTPAALYDQLLRAWEAHP